MKLLLTLGRVLFCAEHLQQGVGPCLLPREVRPVFCEAVRLEQRRGLAVAVRQKQTGLVMVAMGQRFPFETDQR
jgi:hypothetical protein